MDFADRITDWQRPYPWLCSVLRQRDWHNKHFAGRLLDEHIHSQRPYRRLSLQIPHHCSEHLRKRQSIRRGLCRSIRQTRQTWYTYSDAVGHLSLNQLAASQLALQCNHQVRCPAQESRWIVHPIPGHVRRLERCNCSSTHLFHRDAINPANYQPGSRCFDLGETQSLQCQWMECLFRIEYCWPARQHSSSFDDSADVYLGLCDKHSNQV